MEARSREDAPVGQPFTLSVASSPSAWSWYWNRLRCMSAGEVAHRALRKARAGVESLGADRLRALPVPHSDTVGRPFVRVDNDAAAAPYLSAADELLAGRLAIFGARCAFQYEWNRDLKTGRLAPLAFGKSLNYRDPAVVGDIKWLWEPNRHLELVTLTQAYRLSGNDAYLDGARVWVQSWLDQCPYALGPNWTSSLEVGIRLINWSLAWQIAGDAMFAGADGRALRTRWLESIYRHMSFIRGHLSRFSSANNHLIGELSGLYIGAVCWPMWPETRRWRDLARRELVRETLRQNAPDGVNREQAISYQQFVLDFVLLAALAGRANGDEFPTALWCRLEKMLEFIASLMDVRGNVPMIGDADDGYVTRLSPSGCPYRSLLATGAVLFGRGDFKAKACVFDDKSRWLLGAEGAARFDTLSMPVAEAPIRSFPHGGYYILGDNFGRADEVRIVADAGPLGYQRIAAHGHADALAFTLSVAGQEFLVDPGTYAYHTEREWRDYFRGTFAHNTARVDQLDQSTIGGSFLWTHHAQAQCHAWEPGARRDVWRGVHDGYLRLIDPVRHQRELIYDKRDRRLRVTDRFKCSAKHHIERCWHFAESVVVTLAADGSIVARGGAHTIRLVPTGRHKPVVTCWVGSIAPRAGWVSRRFDWKQPSTTVVWTNDIRGTTQLDAVIECL